MLKKCIYINKVKQKKKDNATIDIPKIFWKHFDLFRRGKLSLSEFSQLSGLTEQELRGVLSVL